MNRIPRGNAHVMPAKPGDIGLLIRGRVEAPVFLPIDGLRAMDIVEMERQPLICGSGEPLGSTNRGRGVLLSDVINTAKVVITEHNDTKKMFVVATSDDDYRAVFSWQEIFNTATGEGIVVLFETDGRPLHDGLGGLDLLSARDYLTGPRYVKRLRSIEIAMAE
jgi:hypothetical protein